MSITSGSGGPFVAPPQPAPGGQPPVAGWVSGIPIAPVAAIPLAGFALQNATPTILLTAVPNDGKQHVVIFEGWLLILTT
jgi:hypothetical protein